MLTIYKASAGSGKTFTLAYEYIKILLGIKNPETGAYRLNAARYTGARQANRHRGILAITFTNAATEEMKSRIIRELARLTTAEGVAASLYARWMTKAFGCTEEELQTAASKALSELLYDYGSFYVSTIDSFFQTVLRTFSREVDHQGDYELSLDTDFTVRQSIAVMLDELNRTNPDRHRRLFDWIRRYTLDRLAEGKGYNFFNREGSILRNLSRTTSKSLNEDYGRLADALREYLSDPARVDSFARQLSQRSKDAIAPARAAATAFRASVRAAGLSEAVFNKSVMSRLDELLAGKIPDTGIAAIARQAAGEDPAKLAVGTQLKAAGLKADAVAPQCALLSEFCREIYRGAAEARFCDELLESLGSLDFFGMAQAKLEEYLRENNTVLISDTGELIRRIINGAEIPFIYERLGMRLTNMLIDEFQDTSHLQWDNLRPLVANCLSTGSDCLIIGDEKQAIYRFRNSDSRILGSQVQDEDFPDCHILRGSAPEDNTNHRSSGDVVRVNNTIFSRMAAALGVDSYHNVVQSPSEALSHAPAYVSITFADDDSADPAVILERMAAEIIRQHESGYAWRDILILARFRREATAIVEFLTAHHPEIKVLSSESLLLSSSAAVRTIISMLKLIEKSYSGEKARDDSAPSYASTSDVVMMITRFNYFKAEGHDTADALKLALDRSGEAAGGLDVEIMAVRARNPANLVALIDAIILAKFSPEQRRREYAYIAALQDLAIKHTESSDPSLQAFIAAYESNVNKWAILASADLDAVEIMTVHRSKGLERDCVHIPFADWSLKHSDTTLWLDTSCLTGFEPGTVPPGLYVKVSSKSALRDASVSPFAGVIEENERLELIDNLNTAYVAFTRAARELTVFSGCKNIGRLLKDAVTQPPTSAELADEARTDLAAHYDEATATLTVGAPTVKESGAAKAPRPVVTAGEYPVLFRNDTRELVSIDDAFATHLDIGGEEVKEVTDRPAAGAAADRRMAEAAERGTALHEILAGTPAIGRLEESVERFARQTGATSEAAAEWYAVLSEAIRNGGARVADWFSPSNRIYTERSIYVAATGMSFRPDRIVFHPDGRVSVVDYKFTSEARPEHFGQVENYLDLMHQLGYDTVEGYLWYPLLGTVKRV